MTNVPILVTGIGGGSNGEQILKALQLDEDLGLHIIGTDMNEYTAGKRLIDSFYQVPSAKDQSYGPQLFKIIQENNVQFLFHGSEPELIFISEHRDELNEMGVRMYLNSQELIKLCMNKHETYKKLARLGFPAPKYLKIESKEDLKAIDFFPVVLKPNTSSGGSNHVYLARDNEEALLLGQYLLKLGIDLIVQQYVGTPEDEYTVGVNSDLSGNIVGSIAIQRIIGNAVSTRLKVKPLDPQSNGQYIISSGFSQGIVCHAPALQAQAEQLAKGLKSQGPMNVQCRWVDGKLMLMEINPRLSGTTSLRALAGYNEPLMFIRNCLDDEPWSRDYEDKVIMRGLEEVEIMDLPAPKSLELIP